MKIEMIKCASCGTMLSFDSDSLDSVIGLDGSKLLTCVGCGQKIIIIPEEQNENTAKSEDC